MTLTSYLFDITQATDTGTLCLYLCDAENDDTLTAEEKDEIKTAIADRAKALNSSFKTQP